MTHARPDMHAPIGTPFQVTRLLDDAARQLVSFAAKRSLKLKPYDLAEPDEKLWGHYLYGEAWDREFVIEVSANDVGARLGTTTVTVFVLHYPQGVIDDNGWVEIDSREVTGLPGLQHGVDLMLHAARLACVLRMPHCTDPDLKA